MYMWEQMLIKNNTLSCIHFSQLSARI